MEEFNINTNSGFIIPTHQNYTDADLALIDNVPVNATFNPSTDYIEYFIYGMDHNIIISDYNYQGYNTNPTSSTLSANTSSGLNVLNNITINPEDEFTFNDFYYPGSYVINYNFYERLADSSPNNTFYISEISADRTEIRILNSRATTNFKVEQNVNSVFSRLNQKQFPSPTLAPSGSNAAISSTPAFDDFYVNFGDNTILIATNIALDKTTTNYSVLIKLYEPLPSNFTVKDQLWLVDKIANPVSFDVEIIPDTLDVEDSSIRIKGPNFNLDLKDGINNSTDVENYNSLINTDLTSSYQQYKSILGEHGIDINVDYTEYDNFVHFSSVETRLNNFYYKIKQIEDYRSDLNTLSTVPTNTRVSSSANIIEGYIDDIIENFDGYEYYLYYESGSKAWPKTNNQKPYTLATTGSAAVLSWYSEQTTSASLFDEGNPNNLYYAIPEYLRNDPANDCYELFISMTGQLYDNIWIYYKDVTEKYDADNRLNFGISRDLIAEALRDFGLKIYQNNFSNTDLYSAFLGINPAGGLQPPTGSELITNYVSSSEDMIPQDDLNKSFYKRIYHNLPYLLKTKGTIEGVKTLARIYGIPDTIIKVSEFGGKDKDNTDDWDYWFEEFNYKFDTQDYGFVSSSWGINYTFIRGYETAIYDRDVYDNAGEGYEYCTYDSALYDISCSLSGSAGRTLQFRFKTPGLGSAIQYRSQSLWTLDTNCHIVLEYTGSGFDKGLYSGSIVNPYNEYALLKFLPDYSANPEQSASILLPFYDGGWWSVMATMENGTASLFAGNNIYSGSDGARLGFYGSDSITGVSEVEWLTGTTSLFASASIYDKFSGSLQEIKYYYPAISESVFYDYIMNPQSIEGNGINGGATQLAFRGALGGDLYTGSESIHPKAAGAWTHTASFSTGNSFYYTGSFSTNTEYTFMDQPAVGIKNRITDKIKRKTLYTPSGNVLSAHASIQQKTFTENEYTNNVNLLEVAFSPQNEINDNIISSIGYFNIGEYIGDPRLISSSNTSYPDLDALRNEYFEKYTHNYDVYDYIRLIKYFDNSFFKMVKDFVPSRTSLASGVVIKQHLLERQKYPTPQAHWERYEYTGSIKSIPGLLEGQRIYSASSDITSYPIETISASNGGTLPNLVPDTNYTVDQIVNVTQSWDASRDTPVGKLSFTQNDAQEYITGEFSGSALVVTDGELNSGCDDIKEANTVSFQYDITNFSFNPYGIDDPAPLGPEQVSLSEFTDLYPTAGKLSLWWNATRVSDRRFGDTFDTDTYQVNYIAINKTDDLGTVLTDVIPNSEVIQILTSTFSATVSSYTGYYSLVASGTTRLKFNVKSIKEYTNHYLIEVEPTGEIVLTSYDTFAPNPTPYAIRIANQSNIQTIIEPYFEGSFNFSDCNVMYGNELEARQSNIFWDLDYSTNAIQAVNQQVVISASQQSKEATKAFVQDYNWSADRSIIPRYSGSKSTSPGFNQLSIAGGYGNLPVVESEGYYFAYFNWVGGTSPEWGNEIQDISVADIRFFIGENGEIIDPINDSKGINLSICQQNFERDQNAILSFDDTTGASYQFSNLTGTQQIFRSGEKIVPIIYTQTASIGSTSGGGYTGSIEFTSGDTDQTSTSTVADYRYQGKASDGDSYAATGETVIFDNIITLGDSGSYNSGTGIYEPTTQDPNDDYGVTLYLSYGIQRYPQGVAQSGVSATYQVYKNGSPVGNSFTVAFDVPGYAGDLIFSEGISFTDTNAQAGDEYKVVQVGRTGATPPVISSNSFFNVAQQSLPTIGPCTRFWAKQGSNPTNKIYALDATATDNGLKQFYGQKQKDISGSGFNTITNDFTVQVGDEIRFKGTESQTYYIKDVDTTGGSLILTLDRDLPNTWSVSDLSWFLLRRYVSDPSSIILNVDKPAGGTAPGILTPEYLYDGTENKINSILETLKERNLI